jgi:anti-sigma B factor antagonist
MQITTEEIGSVQLIAIKGRVDSVESARLEEALETAQRGGKYRLVVEMSQLEYMSSAGFRALATAQRNSRRGSRGELVLTEVPTQVYEALELVGFTEYFTIIDPPASAVEYAASAPAGMSSAPAQSTSSDI